MSRCFPNQPGRHDERITRKAPQDIFTKFIVALVPAIVAECARRADIIKSPPDNIEGVITQISDDLAAECNFTIEEDEYGGECGAESNKVIDVACSNEVVAADSITASPIQNLKIDLQDLYTEVCAEIVNDVRIAIKEELRVEMFLELQRMREEMSSAPQATSETGPGMLPTFSVDPGEGISFEEWRIKNDIDEEVVKNHAEYVEAVMKAREPTAITPGNGEDNEGCAEAEIEPKNADDTMKDIELPAAGDAGHAVNMVRERAMLDARTTHNEPKDPSQCMRALESNPLFARVNKSLEKARQGEDTYEINDIIAARPNRFDAETLEQLREAEAKIQVYKLKNMISRYDEEDDEMTSAWDKMLMAKFH